METVVGSVCVLAHTSEAKSGTAPTHLDWANLPCFNLLHLYIAG